MSLTWTHRLTVSFCSQVQLFIVRILYYGDPNFIIQTWNFIAHSTANKRSEFALPFLLGDNSSSLLSNPSQARGGATELAVVQSIIYRCDE